MAFSTCLVFMCALGLQLAQGKRASDHELSPVHSSCCVRVSGARISEPVKECYEQKAHSSLHCSLHAFVFVTESNKKYCVDPKASWLEKRLKTLEKRGIFCKVDRRGRARFES
ncbi:eotaxin-like [Parambassis ranga]|uniref:Eotaxin-like n=1 Tax=Parambassis ranga TaxID=210632 RepID=A0A6P7IG75_9TELE|nr:eotaxin-like [Parambassis ranga]